MVSSCFYRIRFDGSKYIVLEVIGFFPPFIQLQRKQKTSGEVRGEMAFMFSTLLCCFYPFGMKNQEVA